MISDSEIYKQDNGIVNFSFNTWQIIHGLSRFILRRKLSENWVQDYGLYYESEAKVFGNRKLTPFLCK